MGEHTYSVQNSARRTVGPSRCLPYYLHSIVAMLILGEKKQHYIRREGDRVMVSPL